MELFPSLLPSYCFHNINAIYIQHSAYNIILHFALILNPQSPYLILQTLNLDLQILILLLQFIIFARICPRLCGPQVFFYVVNGIGWFVGFFVEGYHYLCEGICDACFFEIAFILVFFAIWILFYFCECL